MNSFLHIEGLYKEFLHEDEKLEVLRNINFDLKNGEFVCILGPSGCGKSTFLRCIGGFEKPTRGKITIDGNEMIKPNARNLMVFQSFDQLFPWRTVIGNITFPLKINGIGSSKKERAEIAMQYLDLVGLAKFAHYYPHQLSGGMKQRIAIVRALSLKPSIILMDEPFASLDAETRKTLQEELINIWKKTKITVLFVTHNIWESIILGTKIVVMSNTGDSIKEIIDNPVPEVEGRIKTPQDSGFTECWAHLQVAIR